jgi:sensor histidine kinase regulating citrate/malate metabolism
VRIKLSLAGQFLLLQLLIVLLVVTAVAGVSLVQADTAFRSTEGHRLLSVGETVAATESVRQGLVAHEGRDALPTIAESARGVSGVSYVLIATADLVQLNGPDVNRRLEIGRSTVMSGRAWVGKTRGRLVAHVPILGTNGRVIGLVAVGRTYPTWLEQLGNALPNLLTYLILGCLVGVAGSLLLARRIKRQTLGLEPEEILGLAEHREAMLHGIREGVVGLDPEERITLANDEAIRLLRLPADPVGRPVGSAVPDRRLRSVLTGVSTGDDQVVIRGETVLVLNRTPITLRGNSIGSVTTLRDRSDMAALQRALELNRNATDAMYAQAYTFMNRMRGIATLINSHRYDEVTRYASRVSEAQEMFERDVRIRVADPAIAALLVAKAGLAAAHDVEFRLTPDSYVPVLEDLLCSDAITVLGSIADDRLQSMNGHSSCWVEVTLQFAGNAIYLTVRDSGPSVSFEQEADAFRHGLLAVAEQTCARRGGHAGVHNETGAVFSAWLPGSPNG